MLELWTSAAPHERLSRPLLEEKIWGDPDFRPELALVCKDQQQLQGFGVAVCRRKDDSTMGYIKLLAVAPKLQQSGIGSAIYKQLEQRCRDLGALEIRVAESAPNYLHPGVDERNVAAIAFFTKHHYGEIGRACNMTVDLGQWEKEYRQAAFGTDPSHPIRVVRATSAYAPAIREFINLHWPTWWGEVSVALRNAPISLFLALEEGKVIGFAAHDANNRGTGWFGPMGTCPQQRGRGIGRVLLAHCLDDMRRQGNESATIPWVGPVDFYRHHCGAVVDRHFVRLAKSLT